MFIFYFPAIGFNVETVVHKNLKFQVWDLGGQTSIRFVFQFFYVSTLLNKCVQSTGSILIDDYSYILHHLSFFPLMFITTVDGMELSLYIHLKIRIYYHVGHPVYVLLRHVVICVLFKSTR